MVGNILLQINKVFNLFFVMGGLKPRSKKLRGDRPESKIFSTFVSGETIYVIGILILEIKDNEVSM